MSNKHGLNASAPQRGTLRDCYEVAATATLLAHRFAGEPEDWHLKDAARYAAELHRISGALHRIAERECNENWPCPACEGEGRINERQGACPATHYPARDCKRCAGHGTRDGRKVARLRTAADEIAKHYGLVPYFQTDPRGCALYLVANEDVPLMDRAPVGREFSEHAARWIADNYTQGHAVGRVGR